MPAFLLVLIIVTFWAFVGFALLLALNTRRNILQNALLAPVTGVAATVLLVMWINCLGLPVRYGGPVATLLLSAMSVWLLHRRPIVLPFRRILPFIAVLLLAAVATGYPMFRFGFNWVSYCNDDMANYAFGGKLFLEHAHFSLPMAADVVSDRDGGLLYWFFFVLSAQRHGADELLAWVLSMTGLSSHQAFMPLILAFQLALISAAGALVMQSKKYRSAALLTCFGLALSALTTLGTVYQLFGQVSGLGALVGTCTLLLRPSSHRKSTWILGAMLLAALGVLYPEVLPFFVIGYVLYQGIATARRRDDLARIAKGLCGTLAFTGLFLNTSLIITVVTLVGQSRSGLTATASSEVLFPYYMTPAGFAYFWGFHAISQPLTGRLLDAGVILGMFMTLLAIFAILRQIWRANLPSAVVCLVMFILAGQLFRSHSDFGLFKIAMFIQPFLLGSLAVWWCGLYERAGNSGIRRLACIACLAVVVGWGARSQLRYTSRSMGDGGSGLVEIPYASSEGLVAQLKALSNHRQAYISDTANVVLGKFETWYMSPVYFPAMDMFSAVSGLRPRKLNLLFYVYGHRAIDMAAQRAAHFVAHDFDMHWDVPSGNSFLVRSDISNTDPMIESSAKMSVVNRRTKKLGDKTLVKVVPQQDLRNYLIFVSSRFGKPYYTNGKNRASGWVSMYQVEDDYFFRNSSMAALGRVSLFRILNPSARVRMVVEYTASLNGDSDNRVPQASVVGDMRHEFGVEGRGSARIFAPSIEPQVIGGAEYIGLDMGSWGWTFPSRRSRILSLYGTDIREDMRKIVGFVRDISVISETDYLALEAPASIHSFPRDLGDKNLEYCGIYEDGWVGESSYVMLNQPVDSHELSVSLTVPILKGRLASSAVVLTLDGREIARSPINSGLVSFSAPVQGSGRRRIELRFDRADNLGAPDNRPVSAQITYVGFRPKPLARLRNRAEDISSSGLAGGISSVPCPRNKIDGRFAELKKLVADCVPVAGTLFDGLSGRGLYREASAPVKCAVQLSFSG